MKYHLRIAYYYYPFARNTMDKNVMTISSRSLSSRARGTTLKRIVGSPCFTFNGTFYIMNSHPSRSLIEVGAFTIYLCIHHATSSTIHRRFFLLDMIRVYEGDDVSVGSSASMVSSLSLSWHVVGTITRSSLYVP
jgi:hypothetical protein